MQEEKTKSPQLLTSLSWRKNTPSFAPILMVSAFTIFISSLTSIAHSNDQNSTQKSFAQRSCTPSPGPTHTVIKVTDGRSLLLDDGTTVRLSGILPPVLPLVPKAPSRRSKSWPPEKNAIAALTKLTVGKTVTLTFANPRKDRYGNLQAHVFLENKSNALLSSQDKLPRSTPWLQALLLQNGYAQAYEPRGQSHCFAQMLFIERKAQQQNLGIWAHPLYQPIPSTNIARLQKVRGSHVRVTGRVKNVTKRSSTTYLNFGTNWRTDFTVSIPRTVLRTYPNWSKSLQKLESKTIEVQGWIRSRNGPLIELEHPAQLKRLEN